MQVFKRGNNIYLINELKSWVCTVLLATLIYWIIKLFSSIPDGKIYMSLIVMFLLKASEAITAYHIAEIVVDNQKGELTFILKSMMSGKKIKRYGLKQIRAELKFNSRFSKILASLYTLKIMLLPENRVMINSRYGFSANTLIAINETLNLSLITKHE